MVATVLLSDGSPMLVDDDAPVEIFSLRWFPQRSHGNVYARRKCLNRTDGRHVVVRAHRLIANAAAGQIVDHVNGNTLDNRRSNLRLTDSTGNARNNRHTVRMKAGRLKGVNPTSSGKFVARIGSNGRIILGLFPTEREAGLAYDRAARVLYGEFAALNFPDESTDILQTGAGS